MKNLNKLTGREVLEIIIEKDKEDVLPHLKVLFSSNLSILSLKARSLLMDKYFSRMRYFSTKDRARYCEEEVQKAFFACLHLKYSSPPPDDKIIETALKIGGEKTARNIFKIIKEDPEKIILFTNEAKEIIKKHLFFGGNEKRILENEDDYQYNFIKAVKALCAE